MSKAALSVWLLAARPTTLAAGITPVLLGATLAWADGVFHAPAALAALAGSLCIQIGTNFANDYFDFVKGTDTAERVGPTRATQAGLVSPAAMRTAMLIVFALTFLPGAYLVYRGGGPILLIGVVSVICGVLYTGGPYPLGYLGLGDIFVLVFFGPVAVAGTYYVQAQHVGAIPIIAGLIPGLFSTAILTVNNLRDADGDVKTGKRTLAVRLGKPFARWEYVVCLALGGVAVPLYLCWATGGHYFSLAALLVLLLAIKPIKTVFQESGPALNEVLAGTGKLLLLFTVVFCIGWLV